MAETKPRYSARCTSCKASKRSAKLRDRIYHAKFLREPGDESLPDIAREIHVSAVAIHRHARLHVATRQLSDETVAIRVAKKTEDFKAAAAKKVELAIDHDVVADGLDSIQTLKEYIAQGHDLVRKGKISINAQSLLQAIRLDVDYESKKKDREVDIIKTMYRFASGQTKDVREQPKPEREKRSVATNKLAASADSGQDGSSDLHNEDAGDAIAYWAAKVPKGDTETKDPYQLTDLLEPVGEIDSN